MSNTPNLIQPNSLPFVLQSFENERLQLIEKKEQLLKHKDELLTELDDYYEKKLQEYKEICHQIQQEKETILNETKHELDKINEQLAMCERHMNGVAQVVKMDAQSNDNHNVNNINDQHLLNQFRMQQQAQQQAQQQQSQSQSQLQFQNCNLNSQLTTFLQSIIQSTQQASAIS